MALLPFNSESLNAVRSRARVALSGFTMGQRVISVLALVGLVVGSVIFMNVESKPSYQPLFTNLQPSDSGAVVAQLTASNVPFQLSDGGATISVPAAQVDQERVALAEQGLPSSGTVGFSNLEKSGITTSQFVQQVEYQQALEGQLQQTIESIQGIQSAQVNLVVPAQSAFAIGTQTPTTASILVDLAPGTVLSAGQVEAIVHLAASATPGLSTSNVTVVDNHGDVLSSPGQAPGSFGSSDSAQTASYDRQLSASLQSLLDQVVGVGNAAVQVHALLNFNQQSTTIQGLQVNAKGQPIVAPTGTNTSNSSYTGAGTPPSGVLGSTTPTTIAGSSGKYTSTSSQVTNAVGQVTQTIKQAPGQVVKTSVAVLLNSSAKPPVNAAKVKSLVSAAAGLNVANGDQLVVTAMPFAAPALNPAVTTGSAMSLYTHVGEGVALVLFILGLIWFALRSAKRTKYDEIVVGELPRAPQALTADGGSPFGHALSRPPESLVAGVDPEVVMSQVGSYIEQRPAEVARLLRAWIDDKGKESK